jgi:hypothetical protein
MNNQLAMPKKAYSLKIDWEVRILLCENAIPWEDHMRNKDVVEIDGKFINFAYVSLVEEVDQNDDIADTAMARARKQIWAYAPVAVERVRSYEGTQWHKMSIDKITKWMQQFCQKGRNWENEKDLSKFYNIYISAGWDPSHLWPFTS